ncbi:permease [Aquipluma nitroreducens]|uniref:Permease n=1 Tax=Aquipluma nitroreducens TaxID=2010828 RepID=A0A5K7S378_9BACT|nr:AI-2E family transporter [Aquipluma nitroreducens]BBE16028.1 permease [Aquipluma nitroreducens]
MITREIQLPFYVKASLLSVGLFAFVAMLYIAQSIIIPFVFSIILAIVLHPVVNFFVKKKFNRVVAIVLALALFILVIALFGAFMFSRAMQFKETWPILVERFTELFNEATAWASGYFDISPEKITIWFTKSKVDVIDSSGVAVGQTLINVGSGLVMLFIIPVYIFMLLFYHPLLLEFIRRLFGADNRKMVSQIVTEIKNIIQKYLTGLFLEVVIVSVLHSVGLLLLGVPYAILLGILGALLNLIPYLGGIVSVALPMMVALATKTSPWVAVYVLLVYYVIQLIDNNYIIPKIVASKVRINALVSIIVVLAFGALWGIPGMFISIPMTAIIKVIFDHIESLKPWGYVLGDTMPPRINIKPILDKILK